MKGSSEARLFRHRSRAYREARTPRLDTASQCPTPLRAGPIVLPDSCKNSGEATAAHCNVAAWNTDTPLPMWGVVVIRAFAAISFWTRYSFYRFCPVERNRRVGRGSCRVSTSGAFTRRRPVTACPSSVSTVNTALVNKAVPSLLVRPYCVSLAGASGTVSRTFTLTIVVV